jgi:hypothetical protein
MNGRKQRAVPARLARAQQRFAKWRRSRKVGARIPQSLWVSATKLAGTYGVSQTATALGLDYYALKKRVEEKPPESAPARKSASTPAFVELASPSLAGPGEYIVEFEDAAGARMRVHLKGSDTPDLIALGRNFWGIER